MVRRDRPKQRMLDCRSGGKILQRGPSLLLILAGGGKPKCLTKILLMQSLDTTIGPGSPIVSFDDEARGLADDPSVALGHSESDLARQGHAPGFIRHQTWKTHWLWFENVRARCFVQRQRDPHFGWSAILREDDGKFDLGPRQGKSESRFTRHERLPRESLHDRGQSGFIQPTKRPGPRGNHGHLFRKERNGSGAVPADPFQDRKVIAAADSEDRSNAIAGFRLGKKAREIRAHRTSGKGFFLEG